MRTFDVTRLHVSFLAVGFLTALSLLAISRASFAQNGPSGLHADPSENALTPAQASQPKKSLPKKSRAARANANAKQTSEEADKAAHLAEGRKKFFERSMGFDNGNSGPITFTGGNGLTPSAGFKF